MAVGYNLKFRLISGDFNSRHYMSFSALRPIIITTAAGAYVCALLLSLLCIGLKPPGLMME